MEALLGGVVVELGGVAGAKHVAGGVRGAEVDVAASGDGNAGEESACLEGEESSEVELEAFWIEKHRRRSAEVVSWGEYSVGGGLDCVTELAFCEAQSGGKSALAKAKKRVRDKKLAEQENCEENVCRPSVPVLLVDDPV